MEIYCQHSKYVSKGLEQYLICSLTGKYCVKQKLCSKRRIAVHVNGWESCPYLKREETTNGKQEK